MINKLLLCSLFLCQISLADTLTLKQWDSNSLRQLSMHYHQQPFLLVFWSLDCPACYKEFDTLSRWKRGYPGSHLIIVSTDSLAMASEVQDVLIEYQLNQSDTWIFANEPTAKIRNSIDSKWFGELPRRYFFDAQHQPHSHSGTLTTDQLNNWQTFITTKETVTTHEY